MAYYVEGWRILCTLHDPIDVKYPCKVYLDRNLLSKLNSVVVNWGDHGVGQGGTLSWWRTASSQAGCRGIPHCSAQCALPSPLPDTACPTHPHRGSPATMQSWTPDLRGKPCSALCPIVTSTGPHLLGFLQTLSLVWSHTRK